MQIIVNIGNSNIRFGLSENGEILDSWTINTKPYRSKDESFVIFKQYYSEYKVDLNKVEKIVIGSVVPHQTSIVAEALQRIHNLQPKIVDRHTKSSVVHHSKQMGTDLYANAVAAHELYDGNKLVIDFGTALTVTGIDEKGEVLGVIIAPGVITSLKALVGDTAQLPDIELRKPKTVLGKDTETCMQSGMVYGYLGMIEGFIRQIKEEFQREFYVISTGGLGHIFQPLTDKINVDDKLHTLKGLYFLGN